MAIPDSVADAILVKCARHCCICRRFAPLHLQVHHIVLKSDGGSDDPDNLIAVCLTCHNDVHTQTFFTRRFTPRELKGHRDDVYARVAEGKLPNEVPGAVAKAAAAVERMGQVEMEKISLTPAQVKILVTAGNAKGHKQGHVEITLFSIEMGDTKLTFNGRESAAYREAFEGLSRLRLFDGTFDKRVFYLNESGYRVVDQLLSMGAQSGMV